MKKQHLLFATFILAGSLTVSGQTPDTADSLSAQRTLTIDEVVVTGTRHQTDIRHLSQTVSVVNRKRIEQSMQPSLLPVLTEPATPYELGENESHLARRDGLRGLQRGGRRYFVTRVKWRQCPPDGAY